VSATPNVSKGGATVSDNQHNNPVVPRVDEGKGRVSYVYPIHQLEVDTNTNMARQNNQATRQGMVLIRDTLTNTMATRFQAPISIVDAMGYSTDIFFLLEDGTIIHENKSKNSNDKIASNLAMNRIAVCAGNIYGVANGCLYKLDMNSFYAPPWNWGKIMEGSEPITYMCSTLDEKNLWVQGEVNGVLYNSDLSIAERANVSGVRRTYGKDSSVYVEVDKTTGECTVVKPTGKSVIGDSKCVYACLDYYGELITAKGTESVLPMHGLRVVQWVPFYIY
jgi:hypothetical protein